MAKKKRADVHHNRAKKEQKKQIDLEISFPQFDKNKKILIILILIISVALPVYFVNYAYSVNHEHGFPLDDPWIHLTFARNLVEYGSFSYFKNEIVTAGSTSPIYTLVLAVGFLLTKNEMILSYILGILFFAFSVYTFFQLSCISFPKENWLALGAVLVFLLDRWMNFISVSGMETTMYIFLLIACFYYYRKRNAVLFAVFFGLTLWSRPDAVAFIGAIIVDYIIFLFLKKRSQKLNEETNDFTKPDMIKITVIFLLIVGSYFAMNLVLSGSIMPNTYEAKLTYYSPELRSRADFLKNEVWSYYTESAYILLIIPFIIGVLKILYDSMKSKYNTFLLPALFIFALVFIYWYKLPYAHRFGRYMMPIIPFYVLVFTYGTREFFFMLYRYFKDRSIINNLNYVFFIIVILYSASAYYTQRELYADQTHHISIRQVATAKWLKDHTPEGSIVATHDVGAIGYYSDRKIIDVAGLINPEFIKELLDQNFSQIMVEEMKKRNVTYIAFLREWYRIVNQEPLFTTGDNNFEIMDVFKFDPQKTHILSRDVNGINNYAMNLIQNKQIQQGISLLNRAISMDPQSSLTYYYLAYTYFVTGDRTNSEKYLLKALEIYPGFREVVYMLAECYKRDNKPSEARLYTQNYLKSNPTDTTALNILKSLSDSTQIK
jgi:tetratricopeptide (TPR) repeat protein